LLTMRIQLLWALES